MVRTIGRVLPLLFVLTAAALTGCASDTTDADSEASDLSAYHLTDAQLASALATPPKNLSPATMTKLIAETVSPVATTARLKLLNDCIAKGEAQVDANGGEGLYDGFAFTMEGVFWGTPRDLASSPGGFGGQSFQTAVGMDGDGQLMGSTLKVRGTAKSDYTLALTVAGAAVTVDVKKGASPSATAAAIAAAIQQKNDAIMQTIDDDKAFDVIGGQHASSLSGVDDVEVSVSKDTITIVVAMNG